MRYLVTVATIRDETKDTENPSVVYSQTIAEADFNLMILIRAVNTRKRLRGPRGKKAEGG